MCPQTFDHICCNGNFTEEGENLLNFGWKLTGPDVFSKQLWVISSRLFIMKILHNVEDSWHFLKNSVKKYKRTKMDKMDR